MDIDFRKPSIVSLKGFDPKKAGKRFFNKTWDQYVYTVCILVMAFTYAFCGSVYSPALVDMKYLFHTSLNNVSYVNTFKNLGYSIGSLFGFLYAIINRQLTIALMVCVLGVFTVFMPFCESIWQLYLCSFISIFGGGAFDVGAVPWLIEIWGQHSPPLLQLLKAIGGLGIVFGPLLDEPFLRGQLEVKNITQYHKNDTLLQMATEKLNNSINRRSKLELPFIVAGSVALLVPIVLFTMYLIKKYKPHVKDLDKELCDGMELPSRVVSPKIKYIIISLMAISMSTFGGMEVAYIAYSSAYYQVIPIHFSAQTAAELNSVMSATLTAGKLVSAFISIKLKPEIIVAYSNVIIAISFIIIYIGVNTSWAIWTGNALIGFGFAGAWSSYYSMTENYVGLTNNVASILQATSAICPMITPFIYGPLIEKSPQIFLLVQFGFYLAAVVSFIMIVLIARKHITNRSEKLNDCNLVQTL